MVYFSLQKIYSFYVVICERFMQIEPLFYIPASAFCSEK